MIAVFMWVMVRQPRVLGWMLGFSVWIFWAHDAAERWIRSVFGV